MNFKQCKSAFEVQTSMKCCLKTLHFIWLSKGTEVSKRLKVFLLPVNSTSARQELRKVICHSDWKNNFRCSSFFFSQTCLSVIIPLMMRISFSIIFQFSCHFSHPTMKTMTNPWGGQKCILLILKCMSISS